MDLEMITTNLKPSAANAAGNQNQTLMQDPP
jgi:hypothetical protein